MIDLRLGDCLEVIPTLVPDSIDCVVTSPPYAEQRKGLYDGISEADYPAWTVSWMEALKPALKPYASVLINIREHVKNGQISDYVLRTRLALRDARWIECDELIWIKPDAPPVGHVGRPRRSWERVLWFSQSTQAWCDAKAAGQKSDRIAALGGGGLSQWKHSGQSVINVDTARSPDFLYLSVRANLNSINHPAAYPVPFAEWMIKLVCPEDGTVIDPFAGSGTTAEAAFRLGRNCIAIEKKPEYFADMQARVSKLEAAPLLLTG